MSSSDSQPSAKSQRLKLKLTIARLKIFLYRFYSLAVLLIALSYSDTALAQDCTAIFPDGASSTNSSGEIVMGWGASITGSPDNVLSTSNLYDNSGGTSCGSTACSTDPSYADSSTYSDFPGGSNIYLGYQEKLTLPPGDYRQLNVGNEAELTLQSGVYSFSFGISTQSGSKILLESGASVAVYSKRTISIGQSTVNEPDSGELLIYSERAFTLNSGAIVNAHIYSVDNILIESNAVLTGAATSESIITFRSGGALIYESPTPSGGFEEFCTAGSGGTTLASYSVDVGSGTASVCAAQNITITLVDNEGNTFESFAGSISLTTSTGNGNWSTTGASADAYGTLTPGANDSGEATYQFAADGSDLGSITLLLDNAHEETLTINVAGEGISNDSSNLSFSANLLTAELSDTLADDFIAGRPHQLTLKMLKNDSSTGECGVATQYNVSQIKVWLNRGANDPSGAAPTLTNAANNQTLSLPNTEPASANFSANFANGEAIVSLQASDVGEYALVFKDESNTFSQTTISGGSDTLSARPFAWYLSIPSNPGAESSAGDVFTTAGSSFTVTVSAVAWQSEDDVNDDGVADGHNDFISNNNADLSNNPSLASFGQETSAEGVTISGELILPSGGNNLALISTATSPANGLAISSFSSGTGSTSQVAYPEVGIIEISASLTDTQYLSSGVGNTTKIYGKSGAVGRFTPAYFNYSASANPITPFCTSVLDFSYLSQTFNIEFDAVAKNALGATTLNYTDGFMRLSSDAQLDIGAIDSDETNLSDRVNFSSVNFSALVGVITVTAPMSISRGTTPDGPFNDVDIGVSITDADNIRFNTSDLDLDVDDDAVNDYITTANTLLRYGRLFLSDAHGPETVDLPVPMEVQYWNGSNWYKNEDDSCSEILLSDITYPDGTIDDSGNRTVSIGSSNTTGNYGQLSLSTVQFVEGDAEHSFSPPGSGNTGNFSVDLNLSNIPWLSYDWDGDGIYTDSAMPTAQYQFGVYRGHDRILYWQEVLN